MTDTEFARTLERADAAADVVRHRVVGVIAAATAVALAYGWTQLITIVNGF